MREQRRNFVGHDRKIRQRSVGFNKKKTARTIVQTVFLLNSGIGIRTPTYRVRVCCATFTQYRYQLFFLRRFVSLSLTVYIIADPFSFVNTFFEISSNFFEKFLKPRRPLKMRNKCAIIKAILSVSRKGGTGMRVCYFIMKFIRNFWIGFCAASAILTIAAAAGLVLYNLYL